MNIKRIKKAIIRKWELIKLNFLPYNSYVGDFLYDKFIKPVRFRGVNININNRILVTEPSHLVLGSNVKFCGKNIIDASGGVLVGDDVIVEKGSTISSFDSKNRTYLPVIIGAGNRVEGMVQPGRIMTPQKKVNGLSSYKGQIVFVVSTGRAGSNAIAQIFSQNPSIDFYHDSFPHINYVYRSYLYNEMTQVKAEQYIGALFDALDIPSYAVHGQSDHKLSALIPMLHKLYPKAKFLWVIRKPENFIASSYPRGWFANSEFGYTQPHSHEFFPKEFSPADFHQFYRLNGYRAGILSETRWKEMTAFERNCWYWAFWNNMIEKHLNRLPKKLWKMVRLSELNAKLNEINRFFGAPDYNYQAIETNQAKYSKIPHKEWTTEMQKLCDNWTGEKKAKWFEG